MIGTAIRLSGERLNIDGATIRIGVPRVTGLDPAPTLYSPLVYIKLADAEERGVTAEKFADSVSKQLEALGVNGETSIPISSNGSNVDEPRRRTLQVKGYTLVGYAVRVTGLNPDESLRLQAEGIGGKRRMGCGLFLPICNRRSERE
jgi:CRISPR-associated endonuclease/helicase Cas3